MKYRFMDPCRDQFPVRLMCRCLKAPPSAFCAWRNQSLSPRAADNQRLLGRMKALHQSSDGAFGSPRMWEELRFEGETCSRNRVARLMRKHEIQGVPQRKKWKKQPSRTRPDGVVNHLEREFTVTQANSKWVTNITYIATDEGWLYLCVVVDLHFREVMGWSMSPTQRRGLVLQAVLMALWQREARMPVILHSDRATQFTSVECQRFLIGHNLSRSMSAVGSCADNAAAESFFGLLKRDRVHRRHYHTPAEARSDRFDYIERFHNPRMRRRLQRQTNDAASLNQVSVISG